MYAFNKKQRLLKKSDYDRVFEQAKKITTPDFVILFRRNDFGISRIGLALSKRLINKSHDRNRVKRLIRESFRQAQLPAIDIVVLARQSTGKQTNLNLLTNLNKTWEKLKMGYDSSLVSQ